MPAGTTSHEQQMLGSHPRGVATRLGGVVPGIGFVATVDAIGADLASFYGTSIPWGGMVFVRLRAPEMTAHGAMAGHAMHGM